MKKAAEACGQKRKRTTLNLSQKRDPDKPQRKALREGRQPETQPKHDDDCVRFLESEIQALKDENQSLRSENDALKLKLSKKHACQICQKSFNRSDGLYKHLWEGDDDHKALAQERYGTTCESCEKSCKSWIGLQRHRISKHGQNALKSADDLVSSESDESTCLLATLAALAFYETK